MEQTAIQNPIPNYVPPVAPPTPPIPSIPPAPPMLMAGKSPWGLILKIIGLVIILTIIGVGVALASRIWDPVWNPFRPNPDKVISVMYEKMNLIKSSHTDSRMVFDFKNNNTIPPGRIEMIFSVDSDINDANNPKADGEINLSADGSFIGSSLPMLADFKIRLLGKEIFIKVNKLNVSPLDLLLATQNINIDNIIGNWIKIPDVGGQTNQNQVEELTKKIQQIIIQNKFYNAKTQLPDKVVDGQKAYNYLVILDNQNTAKLISDLIYAIGQPILSQPMGVASIPDLTKEEILKSLNKIGEISAELLIGKKDNFLYGLKTGINIDLNKLDNRTQGTINISLETNSSKFNQSVPISSPEIFKTLEEILPKTPVVNSKL